MINKNLDQLLIFVVAAGLEPATSFLSGMPSNQLIYATIYN